jgi:nicotinamidase-related amidase
MPYALIVVDMLNDYRHEDADRLQPSVRAAIPRIRALLDAAREGSALTVYVNDNHGDWTQGRHGLSEQARTGNAPSLVEPILPADDVPFLVKARHSAFYETQLEYLLNERKIDHVVLIGQVTEQCILYTALDAYVRRFHVTVPRDAVAHIHRDLAEAALTMMETNMRADVTDAANVRDTLLGASASGARG